MKPFVVEYLKKGLPKLLRSMPGVSIETIVFDYDHLHMVIVIPPKCSISSVMGRLKSRSAHHMRKTVAWSGKVYWKENVVWSPGYFVSSVAVDEDAIRRYVEYQGRKDSDQLHMELQR